MSIDIWLGLSLLGIPSTFSNILKLKIRLTKLNQNQTPSIYLKKQQLTKSQYQIMAPKHVIFKTEIKIQTGKRL